MSTVVTLVPGDTPDTMERVVAIVDRLGAGIEWDRPSPKATHEDMLRSARTTKLALAAHAHWTGTGRAPAVVLREELGVFAQHRPVRPVPGIPARHPDIDLLVVRETTEDVYAHLEHESIPGVFESLKVTTRAATERIARHAYQTARRLGRKKVTIVHKSNIMKLSDGMFLRVGQRVASEYPDIETDEVIVDALCMRLVLDPGRFDVLLCGNLYGDIVGDLCAGLAGGASNAPVVDHALDGTVLFSAGHGDLREVDGTPAANPLPVLLPALRLLRHLGRDDLADQLRLAISDTLEAERPIALGGTASCAATCEGIAARL
ncbi:MAG: NAD-dependent isocitrate dehydrogenase [Alphaproteobacteria bacterium]|nr:NAD-dependent isocitrate dehydrogenase [Alphaproteobacteria bacterium]MCB9699525.1 NAD-dependent isocitrate dehydrogenase [Alphaproteobacteria bacterium]